MEDHVAKLVRRYFRKGLQHDEILAFLLMKHDVEISLRTLKRILKKCKLYRRKHFTDFNEIVSFLQHELEGPGQLHGCRWMHLKCINHGFTVTRDTIQKAFKILDPHGVDIRKRKRLRRRLYNNKGPNYLWHLDSYDKLKPYGIGINGCIDGFSRHIIWLRAGRTNSDPKVIGGYFCEAVVHIGGFPLTVRSDLGTENGHVERFQIFLRSQVIGAIFGGNRPCFITGKSTRNQRIEAWWRILRVQNAQFWMNIFQQLKDDDLFNGSLIDKSLIQYCFMDLIQADLNQIIEEWNYHRISPSKNSISPSGKPAIMYKLPHLYGVEDYAVKIEEAIHLEACKEECRFLTSVCDEDIEGLCNLILEENHVTKANDLFEAVSLYEYLRKEILKLIYE